MEIRTDFKELLELFNKHKVEYLIYAHVPISFIGRDDFIASKRSTRRTKDAADMEALGEP